MPINKKDVEHVAKLARLALTDEEKTLFTGQLEKIVAYIDQLNRLDTKNVEPTAHPLGQKNVWRDDVVVPCDNTDDLLNGAPDREERYFKVKKILE